ncbi:uncharacterized protein LOC120335862 isoform X1 [Styela clava]
MSMSRFSVKEDDPLIEHDDAFSERQGEAFLQFDNAIFDDDNSEDDVDDENIEDKFPVKEQTYPGRKPMIIDAVCHIIEYFQYFALIQSLSLRWTWPLTWTTSASFMFFFNLDLWEFTKVASGAWQASRNYIVPSANVPFNFKWWLVMWFVVLVFIVIVFFLTYRYLKKREASKAIVAGTVLQKVAIALAQVLALPIGVQIGKVFWCNPITHVWNVDNDITCWSAEHLIFVIISLTVAILVYPVYAFWLYRLIKQQVVTFNHRRHEAYLQLKDCEHRFGLHNAWTSRIFVAFASYRRRWVYARPIGHLLKFYTIIFYAALFNYRLEQISMIGLMFFLMIFFSLIPRVYRVTCYNFLAVWCWLALFSNAVTGIFINISDLESAFTTPNYVRGELILINIIWVLTIALWIIYVILRARGVICSRNPLWPTMMSKGVKKLPENTLKYMQSALEGRYAIKKAMAVPALLAPVHELTHQIHVMNALACEAEYVKDPLHSSLRDVLDELIDFHTRVAPISLFSESLKPTVHSTVQDLLKVMPAFTKRLKQREFDFILTSPVRRRLLLKLFIVSCFLNKTRSSQDATGGEDGRGGTYRVLQRLWRPPSSSDMISKSDVDENDQCISDEGFEGDELEGSDADHEIWYTDERRNNSVIVSPTLESEHSAA